MAAGKWIAAEASTVPSGDQARLKMGSVAWRMRSGRPRGSQRRMLPAREPPARTDPSGDQARHEIAAAPSSSVASFSPSAVQSWAALAPSAEPAIAISWPSGEAATPASGAVAARLDQAGDDRWAVAPVEGVDWIGSAGTAVAPHRVSGAIKWPGTGDRPVVAAVALGAGDAEAAGDDADPQPATSTDTRTAADNDRTLRAPMVVRVVQRSGRCPTISASRPA